MRLTSASRILLILGLAFVPTIAVDPLNQTSITPIYVTGVGGWDSALHRVNELLPRMNLTDKATLLTGSLAPRCIGNIGAVESINFPGYCVQDGPLSVRMADLVSVFPAGLTTAATWNRKLIQQRGEALGAEYRGKGAHVALGPVAGPLGAKPLGGRNWEGFSPDPYLTGVAMYDTIIGIQSQGVQATAKHFIGNEQETQREFTPRGVDGTLVPPISSNIDDRTMHELYLWPFADSVRAGVASVMCSYNRLNGTGACESDASLNQLLKTELAFQGYVMSDWFATHSGLESALGGLDMNMPGPMDSASGPSNESYYGPNLVRLVQNGSLPQARLDDMVRRVLMPYFLLGQDQGYPSVDGSMADVFAATYGVQLPLSGIQGPDVRGDHGQLIRRLAAEGTVLVKNVNATLPLRQPKVLGFFGNDAPDVTEGFYGGRFAPIEDGTIFTGGGSGGGRATYVISPAAALKARAEEDGSRIVYLTNNTLLAGDDFTGVYPFPDTCLVFLKGFATETLDRSSFEADWNSTIVVNNVAARCENTIVVLHNPGVVTLPFADHPNVKAILLAHYPGQESGNSIVDILYGDVNPSGKLPYSIPFNGSDSGGKIVNLTGDAALEQWNDSFDEGLLIDYRHFDALNITPRYEFGYGLSYSTFELSEPTVNIEQRGRLSVRPGNSTTLPGGNPNLYRSVGRISVRVRNASKVAGQSVVQLYLSFPQATSPKGTPVRVLRGFEKVALESGEATTVDLELTRKDISFWNTTSQDWEIPRGQFEIHTGFSSRDLRGKSLNTFIPLNSDKY